MIIILWGVFLHSYLTAALEIKNLTIAAQRMKVYNGTRLLIPCYFKTNEPFQPRDLHVEWRVSKQNHSYSPILRAIDTLLEPVPQPNEYKNRAQMYLERIPKGNCSLILNPVLQNDTGRYQVQISTITEEEDHYQQVDVLVFVKKDTLAAPEHLTAEKRTENSSKARAAEIQTEERLKENISWKEEMQDARKRSSHIGDADPDLVKFVIKAYFFLKKNRALLILLTTLMLILFILFLLGSVAGLIFGFRYFKLKKQLKMDTNWDIPSTTPTNTLTEASPLLTDHE